VFQTYCRCSSEYHERCLVRVRMPRDSHQLSRPSITFLLLLLPSVAVALQLSLYDSLYSVIDQYQILFTLHGNLALQFETTKNLLIRNLLRSPAPFSVSPLSIAQNHTSAPTSRDESQATPTKRETRKRDKIFDCTNKKTIKEKKEKIRKEEKKGKRQKRNKKTTPDKRCNSNSTISNSSQETDSVPDSAASHIEDEPRVRDQPDLEQENRNGQLEQQDPVPTVSHSLRSGVLVNSSLQQHPIWGPSTSEVTHAYSRPHVQRQQQLQAPTLATTTS
jgi:hypothetical protein